MLAAPPEVVLEVLVHGERGGPQHGLVLARGLGEESVPQTNVVLQKI